MPRLFLLNVLLMSFLARAEPHRFALVIGSNGGEGVSSAPLRYADDDAVAMHELLREAGVDSLLLASPDEDTRRLHPATHADGPPTREQLEVSFELQRQKMQQAQDSGEEVEWLFFFSGHSEVEHAEPYLGLERGRLDRRLLHELLIARAPARRIHVLIDACRSALLVSSKGPGGRRERISTSFATEGSLPAHVGFVLSSSSARDSHEWERFQSGVFSYEVRSALRGGADVDGDGRVSYAELGAFLHTANMAIPSPEHRPDFIVLPPGGAQGLEGPLLIWPSSTAPAVIADAPSGHLFVERSSGERLLDLNPIPGFAALLHLPTERPLFVRAADGSTERVVDASAPSRFSTLVANAPATANKGSLHLAFRELFQSPFGIEAVSRWSREWAPLPIPSVEVSEGLARFATHRAIAGWTAVGGLVVGAASLGFANQQRVTGEALPQSERAQRNQAIAFANTTGVIALSVAGAGLVSWVALTVWRNPAPVMLSFSPVPQGGAVTFALQLP